MSRAVRRGFALALAWVLLVFLTPAAGAQSAALAKLLAGADRAYARGDYRRAASLLDRAIASQPRDIAASAYAKRASIFAVEGKPLAGVRWIEAVAEKVYPADPRVRGQKAVLLAQIPARRLDAVVVAESVLKIRPQEAALQLLVGDYYLRAGRSPRRAVRAYRAYSKLRPRRMARGDKRVQVKLGFALLMAKEPAAARQRFSRAMAIAGDSRLDILARRGLCAAASMQRRYARAESLCARADREAGKKPDAATLRHLISARLGLGAVDRALEAGARLAVSFPHRASSHLALGDVLMRAKKWKRAAARYRRALVLAPGHAAAMRRLGELELERGRPRAALARLQVAARTHPRDPKILYQRARAERANQMTAQAVATAAAALAAKPDPYLAARVHLLRGAALVDRGQPIAGAEDGQRAMASSAAGSSLHRRARTLAIDALNRAAASAAPADLGRAAELIERARRLAPSHHLRTARNRAAIAIAQKKPKVAIEALTPHREAPDPLTLRLLGRAHLDAGHLERAAPLYARAATAAARGSRLWIEVQLERAVVLARAGDLDGAAGALAAAAVSGGDLQKTARLELARVRCRRALVRLDAGKLELAHQDIAAAKGLPAAERAACRFVGALVLVERGKPKSALDLLRDRGGGRSTWLAGGGQAAALLTAYVEYRTGSMASLRRAERRLSSLVQRSGPLHVTARALLVAIHETVAARQAARGRTIAAAATLRKALVLAAPKRRAVIAHNTLVVRMLRGQTAGAAAALRKLGAWPAQALVNRGVLADRRGDAAQAVKLWRAARARGARGAALQRWIRIKEQLRGL